MNILYIGPYNSNGLVSSSSLDILTSLNSNNKISDLTIRPIYISGNNKISDNDLIKNTSKKMLLSRYDIIIQHCPIEFLVKGNNVSSKNIAIPLFDRVLNSSRYKEALDGFDLVLSDNYEDTQFLSKNCSVKNIKTFDYSTRYDPLYVSNISLSICNNSIKYYTIIEEYNEVILTKIIKAFYSTFAPNDQFSLVLCINSGDNSLNTKISSLLENIKKSINYKSNNNSNINIFVKQFTMGDIYYLHSSCSIFIDAETSNFNRINQYAIKEFKKPVIGLDNLIIDTEPKSDNEDYHVGEFAPVIGNSLLIYHMNNAIVNSSSYITATQYQSIDEILCQ